ncbi:J domain-containing protein [Paraburkholderia sp. J63]|uniref:J domain-containing protein n=1 Tax=Paraburkholderia sp. J63 TaxID=2805434 RepID=UPI002ABD14F1|nr:J domain-containing protein [Paraburkholderia sp. J63]
MTDNYYGILGVREDASTAEINQAYRYAAPKVHPAYAERNPLDAARRFADLARAWYVLSDETRRGAYDVQRHPGRTPPSFNSSVGTVDPEETFASSMVEWAMELRGQGYSGQRIEDLLLLHECPAHIAASVAALFSAGSVAPAAGTRAGGSPTVGSQTQLPGLGSYSSVPAATKSWRDRVPAIVGIVVLVGVLAGLLSAIDQSAKRSLTRTAQASSSVPAAASTPLPASMAPAGPGPYAFMTSVPELVAPDTVEGTATRAATSFHLPADTQLPSSDSGYFNTKVALRVPLPYGKRVLYLLQSVPNNQSGYECHACPVVVSSVITTVNKKGDESVSAPMQDLTELGGFGKYDFSTVALVELGRKRLGLVFEDGWMGMGEVNHWVTLFSIEPRGLQKLALLRTGRDNSGTGQCQQQKSACERYDVAVRFARDNRSPWYPMELTISGMHLNANGVAEPVDGTLMAHYDGKTYVLDKREDGTASSAPSTSATATASEATSTVNTAGAQQ